MARHLIQGFMASVLAIAGLVAFATAASAHNNTVTPTSYPCATPLGTGVTITWTVTNDYPETETGTVSSVDGGTIAYQGGATHFSIASGNGQTTTVTQTFTGAQLASLLSAHGSSYQVTLQWTATWEPDGFSTHANGSSNSSNQGFFTLSQLADDGCVPQKVTPTLTTHANPASEAIGGGSLSDSATLSGGNSPTGTITFYLFNPSQVCSTSPSAYAFKQTVTVSGNSTYGPTTGGPNPTSLGTWHWLAVYSGDSDNNPTNSGCTTEPVTVGQQSPTLTTQANPTSETVGGGSLADSGLLSGGYNPTGTITFYLFNPSQDCSTSPSAYAFKQTVTVSGNGTYGPTSGGPNPTTLGTWHWVAVYSGDANNGATNSGCSSEPVTVMKASPSLGTSANPTTEVVGGGSLADSAMLSGGYNPTGTITFYLFNPGQDCSTSPSAYAFKQTVTVSGNGTYGPTTGGPTPHSAGTWHWLAVYSGDADNNATNSGCTSEPVIVTMHPTALTTQANPVTEAVAGGTLADSATLSTGDSPTGTITFYLFSPGQTCSASPSAYAFKETVSVSGNGTYGPTIGGPNPTTAGTWQWLAVYSGDANNSGSNSGCGNEPVTITKASPSVDTQASPTTEMAGGGSLSDSAMLSSGVDPTGTITFYLFNPSQSCSASPQAGSYTFSQSVSVDGNGSYGPTTGGPNPALAGTWHWLAVYSGDADNNATNSGCSSEPVTVTKAAPSVDTQANPTSGTVGSGTLSDSATLSSGVAPTGTITFYLFNPSQDCSTSPEAGSYAFSQSVTVDGNGSYGPTTGGPTPNKVGTWNWVAVYSGDSTNDGANSGCGNEPVTVNPAPSTTTTQQSGASEGIGTIVIGQSVTDTATVQGNTFGGAPTGSVRFYQCGPGSSPMLCSTANPVGSSVTLTPVSETDTSTATSSSFKPSAVGTYCFAAVYTPAEGANYVSSSDNLADHDETVATDECFLVTTPNFTVTKTNVPGNGASVVPGSTIPYTITIANVGNGAGSATVTDVVPSSLSVQGMPACAVTAPDTCAVANPSGSTWTFTVSLAAGHSATVTFSAKLSATDTADVVNTASITDGICNPSNSAQPVVRCSSTVTNPVPDFTVSKTASPAGGTSVAPGSTIDYTIVAKNVGDGSGSTTVTDVVPSSLSVQGTPVCAVTSPDTCSVANPTGSTWTFAVSLAAGHSATVTFAAKVAQGATGSVVNTATISAPCNTSSGCSSTVTDPVTPVSTAASTTTPAAPKTSPSTTPAIAFTGARLTDEWIAGGAAILLGLGLVAGARRRRRQSPAGSSD